MDRPTRSPKLAELLNRVVAKVFATLRVSVPAVVLDYDPSTQTATVRGLLDDTNLDVDGNILPVPLPQVGTVPVVFPGAGGMRVTLPLQAGDVVLVLCTDKSLDEWKAQGGEQWPSDSRLHHISDAIAIPGLHDGKHNWTGVASDHIQIGQDGAAGDFCATAQRVLTELNKLKSTYDAHTHAITSQPTTCPAGAGTCTGVTASGPTAPALNAPASASTEILG